MWWVWAALAAAASLEEAYQPAIDAYHQGDLTAATELAEQVMRQEHDAGPEQWAMLWLQTGWFALRLVEPERALRSFAEAERWQQQLADPDGMSRLLSYQAQAWLALGDAERTLHTAEQALAVAQSPMNRMRALEQLARAHIQFGQQRQALACQLQLWALAEAHPEGFVPTQMAQFADAIAATHEQLDQLTEGLAWATRAVEAYEQTAGPDDPDAASARQTRARLLARLGQREEALAELDAAHAILLAHAGADSSAVAQSHYSRAEGLLAMGELTLALEAMEEAERIETKLAGRGALAALMIASHRAAVLFELGRLDEATTLMRRVITGFEALGASARAHWFDATSSLAVALTAQGRLAEAERLLLDLEAEAPELLEPENRSWAVLEHNLADVQSRLGKPAQAERLLRAAIGRVEGTEALDVLASLHGGLATVLEQQGHADAALESYQQALRLARQALAPSDPSLAPPVNNLATALGARGEVGAARLLLEGALEALRDAGAEDTPAALTLRSNLAAVLALAGEHARARDILERAIHIGERTLGPAHPDLVSPRLNLCAALLATGATDAAIGLARRTLQLAQRAEAQQLAGLGESSAISLSVSRRRALEQLVSLLAAKTYDHEVYSAILQEKGRARASIRRRREAQSADGDPALQAQLADLRAVRRQLAEAALAEPPPPPAELTRLQRRQSQLEAALAKRSNSLAVLVPPPTVEAVCAALEPGEVLVDLLQTSTREDNRYVAFVLDAACTLRRVDLGGHARLDALRDAHHRQLSRPYTSTTTVDRAGAALGKALWAPLGLDPSAVDTVWWVPDGPLAQVAFSALVVDGRYLAEQVVTRQLASARTLLTRRPDPGVGALLVGGVAYATEAGAQQSCAGGPWAPLPATAREVAAIQRSWRHRDGTATLLTGSAATEDAVASQAPGHRVLHLATHGFFVDQRCGIGAEDPLLHSGLVLAGGEGDGLWTAAEVTGLDLTGTELVVLSACETGRGESTTGEGVLGLRHAFALAGARELVMSLWSVPDEDTAVLFTDFYRAWSRHHDAGLALAQAQRRRIRANRRTLGEAAPHTWAAAQVTGPPPR